MCLGNSVEIGCKLVKNNGLHTMFPVFLSKKAQIGENGLIFKLKDLFYRLVNWNGYEIVRL